MIILKATYKKYIPLVMNTVNNWNRWINSFSISVRYCEIVAG